VVEGHEQCDDGNTDAADGCSASCQTDIGWTCSIPGAACTWACGDSLVALGLETCDDGNTDATDGCSASCQTETGWTCSIAGAACTWACGDSLVALGVETCDDGNTQSSDGCSEYCVDEVQDCEGVWDGTATRDLCGICNSNPAQACSCKTGDQAPLFNTMHIEGKLTETFSHRIPLLLTLDDRFAGCVGSVALHEIAGDRCDDFSDPHDWKPYQGPGIVHVVTVDPTPGPKTICAWVKHFQQGLVSTPQNAGRGIEGVDRVSIQLKQDTPIISIFSLSLPSPVTPDNLQGGDQINVTIEASSMLGFSSMPLSDVEVSIDGVTFSAPQFIQPSGWDFEFGSDNLSFKATATWIAPAGIDQQRHFLAKARTHNLAGTAVSAEASLPLSNFSIWAGKLFDADNVSAESIPLSPNAGNTRQMFVESDATGDYFLSDHLVGIRRIDATGNIRTVLPNGAHYDLDRDGSPDRLQVALSATLVEDSHGLIYFLANVNGTFGVLRFDPIAEDSIASLEFFIKGGRHYVIDPSTPDTLYLGNSPTFTFDAANTLFITSSGGGTNNSQQQREMDENRGMTLYRIGQDHPLKKGFAAQNITRLWGTGKACSGFTGPNSGTYDDAMTCMCDPDSSGVCQIKDPLQMPSYITFSRLMGLSVSDQGLVLLEVDSHLSGGSVGLKLKYSAETHEFEGMELTKMPRSLFWGNNSLRFHDGYFYVGSGRDGRIGRISEDSLWPSERQTTCTAHNPCLLPPRSTEDGFEILLGTPSNAYQSASNFAQSCHEDTTNVLEACVQAATGFDFREDGALVFTNGTRVDIGGHPVQIRALLNPTKAIEKRTLTTLHGRTSTAVTGSEKRNSEFLGIGDIVEDSLGNIYFSDIRSAELFVVKKGSTVVDKLMGTSNPFARPIPVDANSTGQPVPIGEQSMGMPFHGYNIGTLGIDQSDRLYMRLNGALYYTELDTPENDAFLYRVGQEANGHWTDLKDGDSIKSNPSFMHRSLGQGNLAFDSEGSIMLMNAYGAPGSAPQIVSFVPPQAGEPAEDYRFRNVAGKLDGVHGAQSNKMSADGSTARSSTIRCDSEGSWTDADRPKTGQCLSRSVSLRTYDNTIYFTEVDRIRYIDEDGLLQTLGDAHGPITDLEQDVRNFIITGKRLYYTASTNKLYCRWLGNASEKPQDCDARSSNLEQATITKLGPFGTLGHLPSSGGMHHRIGENDILLSGVRTIIRYKIPTSER
jgi:cysteine-rich repeat protein